MSRDYTTIPATAESLLGCRFFEGLDSSARAQIVESLTGRRYRNKADVIRHGDERDDVFFVISGQVEATLLTHSGKPVSFQVLGQGDMFGELAAIDRLPRSTSVVAKGEATLLQLGGNEFRVLIARYPLLAERTMIRLSSLSRYLCERVFESRAYSVPQRILLEVQRIIQAVEGGDNACVIDPAPSHEELATRVGTVREQVTRVIRDLSKQGLLEQGRMTWAVGDIQAFHAEIERLAGAP